MRLCRHVFAGSLAVGSYNPLLNAFQVTFRRGRAFGVADAIATDQPVCANTIRLPWGTGTERRRGEVRVGCGKARV